MEIIVQPKLLIEEQQYRKDTTWRLHKYTINEERFEHIAIHNSVVGSVITLTKDEYENMFHPIEQDFYVKNWFIVPQDYNEEIIVNIKEKKPDLLIVCLGSPRQEIWVYENKRMLSGVGAIMCLGGALDVWAGCIKRAPALFIKMRLEWLWRMICEPKRMKNLPLMFKFQCLTRKSRQKG